MIVINVKMDTIIIHIKNFVKVNLILNKDKFVMKVFLIHIILIKVNQRDVVQEQ